jgi:hypothetical protein
MKYSYNSSKSNCKKANTFFICNKIKLNMHKKYELQKFSCSAISFVRDGLIALPSYKDANFEMDEQEFI